MPNALIDPAHDRERVTRAFAERSSLLALLIAVLVWLGRLFYNLPFGVALFATANLAVLCALLWMFGRSLSRIHKEREEAEADLRHSEERFRVLVTASSQILWSTDPSGMV